MSIEQLARVNPKSCDPIAIRGTTRPLTGEEIAAMLHGTHDGQFYLAMCLYAEQDHTKIVAYYLYNNYPNLYKRLKLENPQIFKLILLAVTEYIDPMKCVTCKGTMNIGDGVHRKIETCPQCGGTGQSKLTDEQKAVYIGIDSLNPIKGVYERLYTLLNHWDCDARMIFNENGLDPDIDIG